MNPSSETRTAPAGARPLPRASRGFRALVLSRLGRLSSGRIVLEEGGEVVSLGRADEAGLSCRVKIRDPRFYRRVALGGSIGAAESYMDGDWSADDLTTLVRIFFRDRAAEEGLDRGGARVAAMFHRWAHRFRKNTRRGSRKNIADHYDLGNDFFATFLDPTRTYSCGIFETPETTLEEASIRKIDLVCRKLGLGPDHEVVEIGTGWGSFAIHAASRYGCRVVTTTISREQRDFAAAEVVRRGLDGRVSVLLEDYRDLPRRVGRKFDRLVSIEMIEAVGHENLGRFFRSCSALLQPEGSMLLQAIVVPDHHYESYRKSADFIRRYIFPGGCAPSLSALFDAASRESDLGAVDLQDLTPHYATTLRLWRRNFLANRDRVEALGFSERFVRMWEYYFRSCEGGFLERSIGDVQILFAKPRGPVPDPVPRI